MSNEIAVYEQRPLAVSDLKENVNLIQDVMRQVMKINEHYGTIPGCGDKPTLLQPGAQKLIMTFRLVPDAEVTVIDLPREHREYRVKVKMYAQNGIFLGSGVGSCSTMEGKFRYRSGPTEITANPVPKEYWDIRKEDPAKALSLIGGRGHATKKGSDGQWYIALQGEKVEHDNPADYYNTCEKMAYKRALVSATLTVTAASDIFTQDVEDMPEVLSPKSETQKSSKAPEGDFVITPIAEIKLRQGKGPYRVIDAAGTAYNTFSQTNIGIAQVAKEKGEKVKLGFKKTQYGLDLTTIERIEATNDSMPGEDEISFA